MLRTRTRRLEVSKFAHDQALHYLARWRKYDLPEDVRKQLTQVVLAFTGQCNEAEARKGIEWMRQKYRSRAETPRF